MILMNFLKNNYSLLYEEFKQFLSVETDIKWIGIFEILYCCGLRHWGAQRITMERY